MVRLIFKGFSLCKAMNVLLSLMFLYLLTNCGTKKTPVEKDTFEESYYGDYVTDSYYQRNERSDWVGVSISKRDDSTAIISIRSRADIKKPTCTFDAIAEILDPQTLKTTFEKKAILFSFSGSEMEISVLEEKDDDLLSFFCSGGGSLKGPYKKLVEPMDISQLEYIDFEKRLSLQGITFHVKSINTGFFTEVMITPENLEIDNRPARHKITGSITGAEVEDLNSDGSPELLVYIQTLEGGLFGDVIGYSVNNKKSMSQIYFSGVKENSTLSKGYFGYDEFTVIETKLGQRFPIFNDLNGVLNPTGKTRQISYKLIESEAQRKFEVDTIIEY